MNWFFTPVSLAFANDLLTAFYNKFVKLFSVCKNQLCDPHPWDIYFKHKI